MRPLCIPNGSNRKLASGKLNMKATRSAEVIRVPAPEISAEFLIHVVNNGLTAHAVQAARCLTEGLNAKLVLLCAQVVPHRLDLLHPPVDRGFTARQASLAGADRVHILLCRDGGDAIKSALPPRSLVVLGARKRWWRTKEEALAACLRRAGHQVILAYVNGRSV
jgi:hypothetical protein